MFLLTILLQEIRDHESWLMGTTYLHYHYSKILNFPGIPELLTRLLSLVTINANFLRWLLDVTSMLATRKKKKKKKGEGWGRLEKKARYFGKIKVIFLGCGSYSLTAFSFSKCSRTGWMEVTPRHLQLYHSVVYGILVLPPPSQ